VGEAGQGQIGFGQRGRYLTNAGWSSPSAMPGILAR
jgi:hypothetical protein